MTIVNAKYDSKTNLTPEEMLAVSQEISLKFSPNKNATDQLIPDLRAHFYKTNSSSANNSLFSLYKLDQCYCPEELYEISNDISRNFAPKLASTVPEIFLLPVDPYHLYAYWQVNPGMILKNLPGQRLVIRVYWRPDANADNKTPKVWFDLIVSHEQARQKIRLPICNTCYSAALGKLDAKNQFTELSRSNIIHVPLAPQISRTSQPANRILAKTDLHTEVMDATPSINNIDAPTLLPSHDGQGIAQGWTATLHQRQTAVDLGIITNIDNALFSSLANNSDTSLELLTDFSTFEPEHSDSGNASGRGL